MNQATQAQRPKRVRLSPAKGVHSPMLRKPRIINAGKPGQPMFVQLNYKHIRATAADKTPSHLRVGNYYEQTTHHVTGANPGNGNTYTKLNRR